MWFGRRTLPSSAVDAITVVVRRRIAGRRRWPCCVRTGWTWQSVVRRGPGIRILSSLWRGKRLAISSIELSRLGAAAIVHCVSGNESLCLRGDRSEDTFLGEASAIDAPAILRGVKAGATDLDS